jgi:hypothetical protein
MPQALESRGSAGGSPAPAIRASASKSSNLFFNLAGDFGGAFALRSDGSKVCLLTSRCLRVAGIRASDLPYVKGSLNTDRCAFELEN